MKNIIVIFPVLFIFSCKSRNQNNVIITPIQIKGSIINDSILVHNKLVFMFGNFNDDSVLIWTDDTVSYDKVLKLKEYSEYADIHIVSNNVRQIRISIFNKNKISLIDTALYVNNNFKYIGINKFEKNVYLVTSNKPPNIR